MYTTENVYHYEPLRGLWCSFIYTYFPKMAANMAAKYLKLIIFISGLLLDTKANIYLFIYSTSHKNMLCDKLNM